MAGSDIWVLGSGLGDRTLKYEGGIDSWTFNCTCGVKDLGGIRILSCEVCKVRKHIRCVDIDDVVAVPLLFVCAVKIQPAIAQKTEAMPHEQVQSDGFEQVHSDGFEQDCMEIEAMLEQIKIDWFKDYSREPEFTTSNV